LSQETNKPSNPSSIQPSVSVVVPSYNHARFVADCLRSIFKQTHPPSELLVIDDGSKDESTQIINSVLRDCPFPCEFIARENRGLSATLNQALALAKGEYFAYLGSDDVWLDGFLVARTRLLEDRPAAILAYGHAYFIDDHNRVVDCTADWADYKDGDVREMLLQTIGPMSPTVLHRREAVLKYGWNESARLEDYELYLRLSLDGEFAFDPKVLSAWRQHGENTSRNQEMMLEEHLAALKLVAPGFGIGETDLESLLKAIRLSRAEDFLRVGDKKKAVELVVQNLEAADRSRLVPIVKRLLVPYSAISWWRKRKQAKANRKYGSLSDML
jgi:alpha-1,3-rhamnosyltransferase